MGGLALYLFAQAIGTLAFAYILGTVAFKERKLPSIIAAAGLYSLMGAALLEVGTDRLGWKPTSLGLNYALVTIGVAAIGSGALLRQASAGGNRSAEGLFAWGVLLAAIACGLALVALAGDGTALVRPDGLGGADLGDAQSHLTTAGRALGAPLILGALALVAAGAMGVLRRRDGASVWFLAGGVLFFLWPLDLTFRDVTMMPAVLLLGAACTYFGFQPVKPKAEQAPTGAGDAKGAIGAGSGGAPVTTTGAGEAAVTGPSPKG